MILENKLIPYTLSEIPQGPYLVFAPHPDDETLGMGGTIALAVEKGIQVNVVYITSGDAGGDPEVRKQEARDAAEILGINSVFFLNLQDRKVSIQNLPEELLVEIINSIQPGTLFMPSFQEVHPDHRAVTHKVLLFLKGLDKKEYDFEIWFYEINRQGEVCRLIDISTVIDRKELAIDCYASQLAQLDYKSQCLCLDYARSISLGETVEYAEGFWCHGKGQKGDPETHYFRHLSQYGSDSICFMPAGQGDHGKKQSSSSEYLPGNQNPQAVELEKNEENLLMRYFRLLFYYIMKIPNYIRTTIKLFLNHGARHTAHRGWGKVVLFLHLKVWPKLGFSGDGSGRIFPENSMDPQGTMALGNGHMEPDGQLIEPHGGPIEPGQGTEADQVSMEPGQGAEASQAPMEPGQGTEATQEPMEPEQGAEVGEEPVEQDEKPRSYDEGYDYQPDFCHMDTVFEYQPLISVIMPVYNSCPDHLRACLDSVLNQQYGNWELCIADDCSTDPEVARILKQYKEENPGKVKLCFRETNGHISKATNSALKLARGEFLAFLDHDDLLTEDALIEVIALLNKHPEADMIYSDEDKIDSQGVFSEPFYKPDWAPENIYGQMYTCHLSVYRAELVKELGGMRAGYEGSQDHDLALRFSEITDHIFHIPKVLYHWRKAKGSSAECYAEKDYASDAGLMAVNDALKRRGNKGWAETVPDIPGCYLVHYNLIKSAKISIIILTRDKGELLDRCLGSIHEKTDYDNYEIIVVDNGSQEQETIDVFEKWSNIFKDVLKIIRLDVDFNYPYLNNAAVEQASGDLVLLLNNDTEVLSSNWLTEMAAYAMEKDIGAVGSCLIYPDNTIQHAGIILGITGAPGTPGVAGHSHKYFKDGEPGYFSRLKYVANYSAVTGACLMVEKRKYIEAGGLDQTLSVAFNDVDFCLKLNNKGFRNLLLPHVRLIHHESKSRGYEDTPEKQKRFANEVSIMLDRYDFDNDRYYNKNLTLWSEDFKIKSEKESLFCLNN